jgi:hypothetical protein
VGRGEQGAWEEVAQVYLNNGDNHDVMGLTLHGGGQGIESPRLHSENVLFCRYLLGTRVNSGGLRSLKVPYCGDHSIAGCYLA